ncbi:MAG: hypothetical protein QOF81_1555 [Acidimicrobiaceae bacterium]|nr:hypothetical protein [Acidimicrobiaceae bacterium]
MTVRTGDLTQGSSPESAETPDTPAGLEEPARAPGAVTPPDAGTLIGAATPGLGGPACRLSTRPGGGGGRKRRKPNSAAAAGRAGNRFCRRF